jgi:hypothetical protein
VSYVQSFFVDCETWFDEEFDERFDEWLDKRFDERLDEIIDDKCDDEIVIHMLSQFKEEHVVDALLCYNVLIFDRE